MARLIRVFLGIALGSAALPLPAQDNLSPVRTVNAFRLALETGNETAALELLTPELLVYELGDQDRTRGEYAAHHLRADMAFLAKVRVRVLEQSASEDGALAWVVTRSRISGASANSVGTETMVLRRNAQGWRVVHIHWSSRPAKPDDG